jgi:hypothetical protein
MPLITECAHTNKKSFVLYFKVIKFANSGESFDDLVGAVIIVTNSNNIQNSYLIHQLSSLKPLIN